MTHTSVFGSYFIAAAPTTPGDSIQRKLLDQKHIECLDFFASVLVFFFVTFFVFKVLAHNY